MRIVGTSTAPIAAVLAAAVLGVGAAGLIACGDDDPVTTTVTEQATSPTTTGSTTSTTSTTTGSTTTGSTTTESEDVSGHCDEAEHADDPECAGGIEAGDDSSGPGSGGSRPATTAPVPDRRARAAAAPAESAARARRGH